MPYRSTREKAEAQKVAREMYVIGGLSLKEIHQQTGETLRTLRSWSNLGDWENLRETKPETELDRLESLRDSLLDKAEAQIKAGKLPHTEIGLMYRLEKLIAQQKKEDTQVKIIALNTIGYFLEYLCEYEQNLGAALVPHIEKWNNWVADQDFDLSAPHFRRTLKREPIE